MARYPFLVGPAYSSWSPSAENQECINFYQELIESGQGKNGYALYGTPGLDMIWDLPTSPNRALYTVPFTFPTPDRVFAVNGNTLYELLEGGTYTVLGTVAEDAYPAYIASHGKQLAIASAQRMYGYQMEAQAAAPTADPPTAAIAAGTFTGPIRTTNGDFLTPASVDFLGGYFLMPEISANVRGQHRYSDLYNVNVWPDLNYFNSEFNPDRSTRGIADHGEYWAFGDSTIQVFALTDNPDFPFQTIPNATIPQGTSAPASPVTQDNTMIWLSIDPAQGGPILADADGWLARRVSNHAVEAIWATYTKETIGLTVSYAFTMNGHPFIQLSFPGANVTWRYDASIQNPAMAWHKVGCWNPRTGSYDAHRTIHHTFGFGQHLVGNR